jgi:hypothetical protein
MLDWNIIDGYNNDVLVEVNIEKGVKLPEFNRELLFERHDGKLFLGKFIDSDSFNSVGFRAVYGGCLMDDVGLNGNNINGVRWAYFNRAE